MIAIGRARALKTIAEGLAGSLRRDWAMFGSSPTCREQLSEFRDNLALYLAELELLQWVNSSHAAASS